MEENRRGPPGYSLVIELIATAETNKQETLQTINMNESFLVATLEEPELQKILADPFSWN